MKRDIPQLHAIRALAMIGIFLHHLFQGIGPLRDAQAGTLIGEAFMDMALGVVVFNVMTSFLLAMPYMGDNPAPVPTMRAFVPRRLWRLCPQYYVAAVLVVLGNAVVYRVTDLGAWLPSFLSHIFFVDSLRPQAFMSNTAAYWWLALLMQFTLAWPLLLKLYRKYGGARLTIGVTLVVWPLTEALKIWGRAQPGGFGDTLAFLSTFNLPSRLPEFLIGMWMAELWKKNPDAPVPLDRNLAALIFGACGLSLVLAWLGVTRPWFANVAWTLALYVGVFALPATQALGRKAWVLWLSGASYAIYLLHQPVLSYLDAAFGALPPWWRFLVLGALGWAFSVKEAAFVDKASVWLVEKLPGKK